MRLIRTATLCILLILPLSGCAAIPLTDEAKARNLLDGLAQFYKTDAVIRSGELEVRAHIYRPDPLSLTAELLSPERLAGFRYTLGEGVVEMHYHGLTFNLDPFGATRTAPIPRAVGALTALLIPEAERPLPTLENGVWQLAGSFDGEDCVLFLSEEGKPLKLLLKASQVEFVFENFVFLN